MSFSLSHTSVLGEQKVLLLLAFVSISENSIFLIKVLIRFLFFEYFPEMVVGSLKSICVIIESVIILMALLLLLSRLQLLIFLDIVLEGKRDFFQFQFFYLELFEQSQQIRLYFCYFFFLGLDFLVFQVT